MRETSLGELADAGVLSIGDGHRAKLDELGGIGPWFLRAGALSERGFDFSGLDAFHSAVGLEKKLGWSGDVVITTKGNSIGRVGWVPDDAPLFVYSPHLSFWRSLDHSTVHPRFLYYWARSDAFRGQLHGLGFGTDMAPYLSLRDQERLRLRLPDSLMQSAIAEMLGALDDKIAANDRQLGLAAALADAIFVRAVRALPDSDLTFGDVAEVGGGGTPRTAADEYWGGDIPWATPTDVTRLTAPYLSATNRMITDAGLAACASSLYPAGSILMTSRATIGAFAIAEVPAAVNQGFIVVNAKERAFQWWLFHEMRSRVQEFLTFANGATFLELARGRFKSFPVRLPEIEGAREFDEAVRPLHALASSLVHENRQLAGARDELLPLLMSGKVRVRDAEKVVEVL